MSKIIDWITKPIHARNVIIIILFLSSMAAAMLAVYGGVRVCTLQEKFNIVEAQRIKIAELRDDITEYQTEITELKEEVQWLKQINNPSMDHLTLVHENGGGSFRKGLI